MVNSSSTPPKVFISYSHDSQEHKDRVLSLADRLRSDGIDCNIDQYEESPAQGWPRWMLNQLEWADFVLVVCTERYNLRFRGQEEAGQGKGVTWEGAVISQKFYDAQVKSTKFIPIIFSSEDEGHIPIVIRGFNRYKLDSEAEYEKLYRLLTNQHDTPKPELGKLRKLAPRARKQSFFEEQKSQPVDNQQPFVIQSVIPSSGVVLKDFGFQVITVNSRGEEVKRDQSQAQYFTEELDNGVTLDMIAIPGGKFMMGSPEGEGYDREKPQHDVTVQPFFIGKYPITQAQYQQVMSKNPSKFKAGNRPVENLSWEDAVEFCQRLSKQTKREYRLPSEAEWEYACRSVISHQSSVISEELTIEEWNEKYHQPFNFGETIITDLANYNGNYTYANEPKGKYREKTIQVGSFLPNAFGLYDMHGNVWEWCQDDFHENYRGAPIDGKAWISGASIKKVLRGGSWLVNPFDCRSAIRFSGTRDCRYYSVGFRVICIASRST